MSSQRFDGLRSFDSWIVGQDIGDYRIGSPLGAGGMSSIYKAQHPVHGDVVFKFLRPSGGTTISAEERLRFTQEAEALKSIRSSNVVEFLETGEHHGIPFIVMPFLDGWNLFDVLRRKHRLPSEKTLYVTYEVCRGLAAIHAQNIIHRDIKPENVMIVRGGGIKIVDLGIARHGDAQITAKGQLVATLAYSSPEHLQSNKLTVRSDLFSVGAMLYVMLTGEQPFAGETTASTLYNVMQRDPKLPSSLVEVPPQLDQLVMSLLAKDPEKRPPSAKAVADECQRIRAACGYGEATKLDSFLKDSLTLEASSVAGRFPFVFVRHDLVIGEQSTQDATNLAPLLCAPKPELAEGEKYTLGRGDENAIVIPVRTVSRLHAWLIGSEKNGFFIRDAGSTNGTYVNGEKTLNALRLRSGDVLTFGPEPSYVFYTGNDLSKVERLIIGR
jgi:serine/threonine protein kinase